MDLYLNALSFTVNNIAPIFLITLLGYGLRTVRLIDETFIATASQLVFKVTFPIMIFFSILRMDYQTTLNPILLGFLVVAVLSAYSIIWLLAARFIQRPDNLGVFVQGAFRSNYGIIGLAISVSLFGQSGLAQGALLLALVIPLYNTLSIIALTVPMQQQNQLSLGKIILEVFKNPLILAVLAALPLSYTGIAPPEVLKRTGEYCANMTLPLALLTIGATLNLNSLKSTSALALWATGIKLLALPLVLTTAAWLTGFRGQDLAILFVLFGCPTAAASFIMAKALGGNAQLAANIVLLTTLGSAITLSAGIYFFYLQGIITSG